jgi:hypothetical protein
MLVSPIPGASRENVERTLSAVLSKLGEVRVSRTMLDRYNNYVGWANEAARMLRTQVKGADVERLVLTRRYWLLQSLAGDVVGPVGDLVDTELDDRQAALSEAIDALRRQIQRWSPLGRFVVLDTNIYIEHPDKLEAIDLAQVLSIRGDAIHVLVPMIVVDELDNLKRSSHKKTRWRAGYTLAVLDRVLPTPTEVGVLRPEDFSALNEGGIPRGGITIEVVLDPPGHTRLPISDDEIIDRTLAAQALAGRGVTLLTYDTGQATRARAVGLEVVKLDHPSSQGFAGRED